MKTKLLDQSTTSQDEEIQQKKLDESHKKEGIFKWLVDLYKITEDDVNMYAGTEAVVYLAFVRQVALLFLLIFLLGGCQLTFHYMKLSTHEN